MGAELGELHKALEDLIHKNIPVTLRACKVDEVDKNDDTIDVTPVDGGPAFNSVKLKAVKNSDNTKMVTYPAVGSNVIIGLIRNNSNNTFVVQYSAFESILIQLSNDFKCELKNSGDLIFNDGQKGGLINITDLTTEINSRLTAIQTAVAAGFSALAPLDNSASINAFNASWAAGVTNLQKSTYEDTKIKH